MGETNENGKFYIFNGKDYEELGKLTEISITLSEEDSNRLWAMIEGLEIVPNDFWKE